MARLPLASNQGDRAAGYWWEFSMRQIEVSRTVVFDVPRNGWAFFDALCSRRSRLDLGDDGAPRSNGTISAHRCASPESDFAPDG
jgi:hypothetical protein